MTPTNWKKIERHPLSAAYRDLDGKAFDHLVDRMKRLGFLGEFPIVLFESKILDGWQRRRAAVEAGAVPTFIQWKPSKKCPTPDEFVEASNDHRRHETQAEAVHRIEQRRARVAEKREEGKSLRTIAAEENVSESTVRSDLASSGAQGCAPEKVTGADGKQHPAKKKSDGKKQGAIVEPREPGDDSESEAAAAATSLKAWLKTDDGKEWKKADAAFGVLSRYLTECGHFAKHRMALNLINQDLLKEKAKATK